jgi:ribulose-5-phosphate 4-epimerase/fuculose-1-phosphate aldolase
MRYNLRNISLAVSFALGLIAALPALLKAQPTPELRPLVEDLVAANRILYRQGVLDGFGHVSVRHPVNPDRFLMSTAKAPGRVGAEDIIEFDLDGKAIDRRDRPIYAERFIHSEVYRARPDVNAIVHSHSPTVIPFSVTQVRLRPVQNSAAFLAAGVPIFEMRRAAGITDNVVTSSARGRALAETLGSHSVVLLRGHGNVVVGPELRRTVARAIYTEVNARTQLQAVMLGGLITFLDPEEARLIESKRDSEGSGQWVDRSWHMWLEELARGGREPVH